MMEEPQNICWILSDGTVGMEVQAVALAKAMSLNYIIKSITPSNILRIFPGFGVVPGISIQKKSQMELGPPYPRFLITCGRRHAGAAIALKRISRNQTYTIHIQDPRIRPTFFDTLVVPEHDPTRGANVITSKGSLNNISATTLEKEGRRFASLTKSLPNRKVAINIGGSTRNSTVTATQADKIVAQLRLLADQTNCGLMITTSARTDNILKNAIFRLSDRPDTIVWSNGDTNPYIGFLALADSILVTSDSINMISEACSTGKPVYVLPMGPIPPRRRKFLHLMEKDGRTRFFDGHLETWTYEPLKEAERIARVLRRQLQEKNIL
ncbi:MAG: hypothetical protein CMM58_14100 [Rhodospirillaceae bacterium]|nr:hypothetical protein [Rhodospirillaceae bacterium]|tara:strand:- start:4264 stop:5238 length:975 start_codon:yes stop_codon:yes gene_type:complete